MIPTRGGNALVHLYRPQAPDFTAASGDQFSLADL